MSIFSIDKTRAAWEACLEAEWPLADAMANAGMALANAGWVSRSERARAYVRATRAWNDARAKTLAAYYAYKVDKAFWDHAQESAA